MDIYNEEKTISVIVPAYNVEDYLERCLDSICQQTYKDLEIIIINDGSTDKTEQIAKHYACQDKRIKVISQRNKGLAGARNTGIFHSHGQYIGFIDSDDWIPRDYYEKLLGLLKQENADVVTTDIIRIKDESEVIDNRALQYVVLEGENILMNYMRSAVEGKVERISACSKLYNANVIGNSRFEEGRIYEDIDFNWEIYNKAMRVVIATGVYYYYYINIKSITKTKFSKSVFDLVYAAEVIVNNCSSNNYELLKLIRQYRARADFSVFVRMLKCNCDDDKLMKNQLSVVRRSFILLIKSRMPYSRRVALLCFKILPFCIIKRIGRVL